MFQVPLCNKDWLVLWSAMAKNMGIPDERINQMIENYHVHGTIALLQELFGRGWYANEEDIIAYIESEHREQKTELLDNLDRIVWTGELIEHVLNWLVQHQRGCLSPVGEVMKNWTRETFDRVVQQLPEMDLDEEDVDYSSDDAIDQPADDSKTEG
jgi:hypothetical protein